MDSFGALHSLIRYSRARFMLIRKYSGVALWLDNALVLHIPNSGVLFQIIFNKALSSFSRNHVIVC